MPENPFYAIEHETALRRRHYQRPTHVQPLVTIIERDIFRLNVHA